MRWMMDDGRWKMENVRATEKLEIKVVITV